MAIPLPDWRRVACRRPSRHFSARDVRIIGTVASVSAAIGGVGIVGSIATSLAVPAAAKVLGWGAV